MLFCESGCVKEVATVHLLTECILQVTVRQRTHGPFTSSRLLTLTRNDNRRITANKLRCYSRQLLCARIDIYFISPTNKGAEQPHVKMRDIVCPLRGNRKRVRQAVWYRPSNDYLETSAANFRFDGELGNHRPLSWIAHTCAYKVIRLGDMRPLVDQTATVGQ